MLFGSTALTASLAFLSAFADASAIPLAKRGLKFNYAGQKVRGVNLGGWFVLEPWITPSIFEQFPNGNVVDEFTLTQVLGKTEAYNRLSAHWSSWITQPDFQKIAASGLNHVRIPIGYWSILPVAGDPYVQGAYDHLKAACDWAQGVGLKVMIDLHGAPGSQNGFDNSGRRGPIQWTQGDTVTQTKNALNRVRDDLAGHPAVAAIELLNEPMGPVVDHNVLTQFYYDGWGNLRDSNVAITVHDAFLGVTSWNSWGAGLYSVILDTHHYEIFDVGSLQMSPPQHVSTACGFGNQMTGSNKWTIAGEWTGAQTDCAKWLNGYGTGARYDGTFQGSPYIGSCAGKSVGTVPGLSAADKSNLRHYIEAQLDAFEKAKGWIFWTWKTESAPEWDMQALINNGLFPQPLTDRRFPHQCG